MIVPAILLNLTVAGCGATFDPTGTCTADGSAPGAYPDIEAAIPTTFRSARPARLDSGRTCTASGLGTLAARGVAELRFAGGTWATGTDSGVSLAVFIDQVGPALDPAWIAAFYEAGARAGKNVTSVDASVYPVSSSISGRRIDVLNGESFQSVVVWQRGDRIAVALVADFIRDIQTREAHDTVVRAAVDAFGG
ncbi:MAG: hypothetical protein NVS9B8_12220 [Candidatus Limnocylindrales bacterium]